MKTRSKVGMIVLVDILAILVLLLASRLAPAELRINISPDQDVSIESGVTVISKLGPKRYEYLTKNGWREFDGSEVWQRKMITLDCNLICDDLVLDRHIDSEILIIGELAEKVLFTHFNQCRENRSACNNRVYTIDQSDFLLDEK